jgi:predicted transcriptional regulator
MTMTQSIETIEQRAADLRDRHPQFVNEHGLIDVHGLVEAMGGEIEVQFSTPDRPESLQAVSKSDFTIIVPWNTSLIRDRFTIAHELGHLELHYQDDDVARSFYRYGTSRQEAEANAFAAALLMPAGPFAREFVRLAGDPRRLSETFGVSRSAIGVRASVLNLA